MLAIRSTICLPLASCHLTLPDSNWLNHTCCTTALIPAGGAALDRPATWWATLWRQLRIYWPNIKFWKRSRAWHHSWDRWRWHQTQESQNAPKPSMCCRRSRMRQCSKRQRTHSRSWWTWWNSSPCSCCDTKESWTCAAARTASCFFQQRSKRRPVEHPDGHTEMAGTAQDHPAPSDDAETAPDTEPLHRSVDQSDQAVGDQARGSALSSIDSDQPDRRERELGVPGMGPQCSEPGEKQQEAHQHEPDVTVLPGTSGSVSQPGLGSMLPVPAEQCECNSQSSAAPTESPGRSRVGIAGDAVPQQCMDAAPKRFGQCHPTILGTQTSEGQWEGEAQAEQPESGSTLMPTLSILMHVLSHLCLRNDLNWCYANSTIFCLLWTFMTMQCDFSALGGGICRDDSIFALSQPTTGCTRWFGMVQSYFAKLGFFQRFAAWQPAGFIWIYCCSTHMAACPSGQHDLGATVGSCAWSWR